MTPSARRYVRSPADLPEHDLVLSLPGAASERSGCHVRHYVHDDRHTVIVGRLDDGGVGLSGAALEVARHVATTVVPEGREFVLVAYAPQPWFNADVDFKEVTFEVDGGVGAGRFTGLAGSTAGFVTRALMESGFDVYAPGENGYVPDWRLRDRRLVGMVQASLLDALDACSMVVVPYDGEAVLQAPAASVALNYAAEQDVPVVVAHHNASEADVGRYGPLGYLLAEVHGPAPLDVSSVIEAVDRRCAAFECLSEV